MPRFVVLEHDHPQLHWDLMLERDGTLATWRLARPPVEAQETIIATRLPDHRLAYLDYEGAISGGRGTVTRWDHGEYVVLAEDAYEVRGTRLHGTARLLPVAGEEWRCDWQQREE